MLYSHLYFALGCQGTAKVQVIFFNISEIKELHLSRKAFKKMHHLRLLKIYNSSNDKYCKLCLSQGLQYLPDTFRYLHWEGYPLKTLPSKIFPENLLELRMPHSQVEHLTVVPDLSESPN